LPPDPLGQGGVEEADDVAGVGYLLVAEEADYVAGIGDLLMLASAVLKVIL
jgi:hypothetical protein